MTANFEISQSDDAAVRDDALARRSLVVEAAIDQQGISMCGLRAGNRLLHTQKEMGFQCRRIALALHAASVRGILAGRGHGIHRLLGGTPREVGKQAQQPACPGQGLVSGGGHVRCTLLFTKYKHDCT